MAIRFDYYESPPKEGEEGKKRLHARPILSGAVDTEEIVSIIHERSAQSKGDILSTLSNLGQILSEQLQDGKRVHIKGIGYFHVTLSCADIQTEKDMRASHVGVKSVTFRSDKSLRGALKKTRVERVQLEIHSARLSNEEVDHRVAGYFKENQVLTRRDFQRICQMTQSTAFRHIHRLLEEGKLKNIGTGRQPIYVGAS